MLSPYTRGSLLLAGFTSAGLQSSRWISGKGVTVNAWRRTGNMFIFYIQKVLTGEPDSLGNDRRACKERNCCHLPESSWGSDNHRDFHTVWPVLGTVGSQTPSSVKPKQITLTVNRTLLSAQLRGVWKLSFGNSFGMRCRGLDVKMQRDEQASIKYQINSSSKTVTEAHLPLQQHTHAACYWQCTDKSGNLSTEG